MAGDWIKMRTNLDTDPRVFEMATELDMPELHVIGLLWKVWAWADSHTLDASHISVTTVSLDRLTSVPGFAAALRKVGWLAGRDGALTFPRFAEHNGQTAKKRLDAQQRQAKSRSNRAKRDQSGVTKTCDNDVTKAQPEKRREEKKKKKTSSSKKFVPPTVQEVAEYCQRRGNTIDPQQFVDHYAANGWMRGKNKIRDWRACVRTWEGNQRDVPTKSQTHGAAGRQLSRAEFNEQANAEAFASLVFEDDDCSSGTLVLDEESGTVHTTQSRDVGRLPFDLPTEGRESGSADAGHVG